jgi:hypothetical protein
MSLTTVAPGVGGTGLTAPGTSGNILTSNGTAWTSGVSTGIAKAWVNFNGTGTVAIRASYNVSSITDNGTGQYTVNFTNAFADVNYSAVASAKRPAGSTEAPIMYTETFNTSSLLLNNSQPGVNNYDSSVISVAIFSS